MPQNSLPDADTLRKAADILQAAHDAIEIYGFDIQTYGYYTPEDIQSLTSDDIEQGSASMCYIGAIRFGAGLDPDFEILPAVGDGPELIEALKTLDKIAKRRLPTEERQAERESRRLEAERCKRNAPAYYEQYSDDLFSVGRFVEKLGFLIERRADEMYPYDDEKKSAYQKAYALKLLRRALTEIHTKLNVDG